MLSLHLKLIVLINLIVFFRTLSYDLVIDDNCRRFHVKDLAKNWIRRLFRVTRYSGFGGVPVPVDHLLTLGIHTTVCCLSYLAFGGEVGLVTALLFAVNPTNNQVSIWLNGKRFGMMTVLILLFWILKPWGTVFYLLTPLWHYGAMPGALLLLKTPYAWAIALGFIPLILFGKKIINKIGTRWESIPQGEIKRIRPRKLVLMVKTVGYIFWHCLVPRRMSFYHMFMERFGFSNKDNDYWYSFNKDFWIGLPTLTAIVWLTVVNWNNPIGFGLFWWAIFIFPWCQFPLGITQAISERTFYLPNVGLMYALAYALRGYPLITVAVLTFYLTRLWFYMPAYRNLDEFYRYALAEFPDHFRARSHVIQRNLQEGRLFWCLRDAGVGLRHHPEDCTLNMLMGQSLMSIGGFHKALEYFEKAEGLMVPGQEDKLTSILNEFKTICKNAVNKPGTIPKRIKPTEVVEIKPSQIVGAG